MLDMSPISLIVGFWPVCSFLKRVSICLVLGSTQLQAKDRILEYNDDEEWLTAATVVGQVPIEPYRPLLRCSDLPKPDEGFMQWQTA